MQDADAVEKELKELVKQVGEAHVVLVVVDGASPNKAAMARVEEVFPKISCIRCMAHLTQLFFKDVSQTTYFNTYIEIHKELGSWVRAHDFIWDKFLEHSRHCLGKELRPIKFGETRYGSWYAVMERNLVLKDVYRATVSDGRVRAWVDTQRVETKDR